MSYYYGEDHWQPCGVCTTRRPPEKLLTARVVAQVMGQDTLITEGFVCNDGWCQRARKLDDLLARVEAIQKEQKEEAEKDLAPTQLSFDFGDIQAG